MATLSKAVNYTAEMIQTLQADYKGEDNKAEVAALAAKLGKKPASIVAKLSNLKIYKPAKAVSTASKPKYTKAMRAVKVCNLVADLNEDVDAEALEKTSVRVLQILEAALTND